MFFPENLESICQKVDKNIDQDMKEEFQEFLTGYAHIFIENVGNTKDHTYNNLNGLIKNENLCLLSRDKDCCVIIMNKQNNIQKLKGILDEVIMIETYEWSIDTTKLFKASYTETTKTNYKLQKLTITKCNYIPIN